MTFLESFGEFLAASVLCSDLVLDEMLDLDGLSILFRLVLSLKRVMLFRGRMTPPFDVVGDNVVLLLPTLSTLLDFWTSSRLDFRKVFVCWNKMEVIFGASCLRIKELAKGGVGEENY